MECDKLKNGIARSPAAQKVRPLSSILCSLGFLLVGLVSVASSTASDLGDGPILSNPMEKLFDAPLTGENAKQSQGSRRPQFSDGTLPSTSHGIRQTSGIDTQNIWDRQLVADNATSNSVGGFSGWGIGVPPDQPAQAGANSSTYGWATQGQSNGFQAGPSTQSSMQHYFNQNVHSNIDSEVNASPQWPGGANLPTWSTPYGTAWNDQALFANPSANPDDMRQLMQQQLMQQQLVRQYLVQQQLMQQGLQYGMNGEFSFNGTHGSYDGGYGGLNPYASAMPTHPDTLDAMQQYRQPYQRWRQQQAMSQGMQAAEGDLFSEMLFSGQAMQNPALMQTLIQQEELRHRQALAEEDEEERKKEEEELEKKRQEQWSMSRLMPVSVSSPLGKTVWNCVKTVSPFNTPDGPNRGVGMPLANRSWLDRPYYFGGFIGSMRGSTLVSNQVKQKNGASGGLMLGYNIGDYWGIEGRVHYSSTDIYDTDYARELYLELGGNAGYLTTRTNELAIIDFSVHYYPLGNAKFRPYAKYGLGLARERFQHTFGSMVKINTMTMPVGVGLRYWWNERLAFQFDAIDNIVFSKDSVKTQNNWAFTVGVSYSFGNSKKRRPVIRWPYTPSTGTCY